HEVPAWAAEELQKMGPLSGRERILSALVLLAITLWMFGAAYVEATTAALIVISLIDHARCHLERDGWQSYRLDHHASRDVGDARRWPLAHGLCQMVCRWRRGRRTIADVHNHGARDRVLLFPLYVREPHVPHERHDAGDAGGRPRYTRCSRRTNSLWLSH